MGRRTTRRQMMNAKKRNCDMPGYGYVTYGFIAGVTLCVIFVAYFTFATSNHPHDGTQESPRISSAWHNEKLRWELKEMSGKEFEMVVDSVKIENLNEYLKHLLVVRTPGSEKIKEVKRFIAGTMDGLGWEVEEDTFIEKAPDPYGEIEFTNVIATQNPKARRRLVLACHYDSKVKPEGFLGATDSAVPCAMLLELARALNGFLIKTPEYLDVSLQYVFFDGEEAFVRWTATDSIYGARHLAEKWEKQKWPDADSDTTMLDRMDVLMLLDLLGEKDPRFYDYQSVKSKHYQQLPRIEKRLNDKKTYFHQSSSYASTEDDHIPFLRRKVPVLHVIPSPFPRQWHRIADDGKNLDDTTILRLTKIFAVFVTEYLHIAPKS